MERRDPPEKWGVNYRAGMFSVPADADLTIDTTNVTPEEAAQQVLLHLEKEGYIGAESGDS